MEFTQEFHDMEVDLVITTVNSRRMRQVSNSSKFREVRHHLLPATNNLDQVNGIFLLTIHIILTSILDTTIRHYRIMLTITSRTSWTWTNSFWPTIACFKTITTTALMDRCVEHFCLLASLPVVNLASQARDRFNYGNSYLNFSPIKLVKASFHGLAMAGNLSWLILMR